MSKLCIKFLVLFLVGIVTPTYAVPVTNNEPGSSSSSSSGGSSGTCPDSPPLTATASISSNGSSYSTTSATVYTGNTIYLKGSYTKNYEGTTINGYSWTCENCDKYTSGNTTYVGYSDEEEDELKSSSSSFSGSVTGTYKAGTETEGSNYITIAFAIDYTCVTQTGTVYDYVNLYITEPPEEEDDQDEGDATEDPENIDDEDDDTDECTESTWYEDSDDDGYGSADNSTQACDQPTGYVSNNSDCDDQDSSVNTSATEVCDDEVDNDCDGTIDSDIPTWYLDSDGDGYGTTDSSTQACDQPSSYVSDSSDCDDTNSAINPLATETEDDGIDQNCSGADSTSIDDSGSYATDECITNYTDACLTDEDGDGFCESNTECSDGSEPGDCDDSTSDTNPDADEICDDGVDNNCDGLTIVTSLTKGLSTSNLSTSTSYTCIAADEVDEEGSAAEEEDGGGGCGCDIFGTRKNHSANSIILILILAMPVGLVIAVRQSHPGRQDIC